ncbi:diguanylate cyclase [uncultured Gammaproteobacteria bacterium]
MAGKLIFAKKNTAEVIITRPWPILIVDDEIEVHSVTRLALGGVTFKGRPLEFVDAHSAAEARQILAERSDIALILLDVVMETDDAGLRLIQTIREELSNRRVRIVLRTGQPGQAPEHNVIINYDINDYKAKTELTQEKLFTTVIAALRSYDDIVALDLSRRGLERIIDAASSLFQKRSMRMFASGVLTQVGAVLGCGEDGILAMRREGASDDDEQILVMAAAGQFLDLMEDTQAQPLAPAILAAVRATLGDRRHHYGPDYSCLYLLTPNQRELAIYVRTNRPLTEIDRRLVEVLGTNISIGLDNVNMYESLADMNRNLEAQVRQRTAELDAKREEAEAATQRFKGIIELAGDAVVSIDADHRIILFNPAGERVFGYSAAQALGQPVALLLPPSAHATHADMIARFVADTAATRHIPSPVHARRANGQEFPIEISISKLKLPEGLILTAVIRDITDRLAFEERLRHLAATDPLTGAANRRSFMETGIREFSNARRHGRPLSVAMLDADHFKLVNDRYGHAVGDEVLRHLVARGRTVLRTGDLLGRYGGEEFVVLLPNTPLDEAAHVGERLRAEMEATFVNDGEHTVRFTVSVGVATMIPETESIERLLADADKALYAAKTNGRNRVERG